MGLSDRMIASLPASIVSYVRALPMGERLAKGAFWSLVGAAAAKILNLPISMVLARLMGPAHYGELGIIVNSIDLFGVFAGFGLALTATKHVAEFRSKDPVRAGRILALSNLTAIVAGGLFSIVLFLSAPLLASRFLAAPQLAGLLRIGAVFLFLTSMTGEQNGALGGFEAFRLLARLQTIFGLVSVPLVVGGYFFAGLRGILWGMVAAKGIDWSLRVAALHKEARHAGVPITYHGCLKELPILWHFSIPAVAAGVLVAPVNWICSAMLVNRPSGYVQMGEYNAAGQWYGVLLFLPTVLAAALLPSLSSSMGNGDSQGSRKVLSFMLRLNAMIVLPCVIGISILSPYIMRAYGREFHQAWPTLIVVSMTAGIFAIITPVGDVIAASGRMWLGCAMNAGWGVIFISATWLLVGRGSLGLALARFLAYVIHAVWTFAFAYQLLSSRNAPSGA
jgi:O-antigen/teichoic acid export membrane protein